MVRIQIRLTPDQAEAIKREAAERGVSMAEIIRGCIEAHLRDAGRPSDEELRRRALSIIGMARGGPSDISRRHDDYFVEACEE